jgi:hypothetical protein
MNKKAKKELGATTLDIVWAKTASHPRLAGESATTGM